MKYALTAKHSLLLCDLILYGVARTGFFKKALEINYKIPESLILDHRVYWNFDNDEQYNSALLKNRTLTQAVQHFISSLTRVTTELDKTAVEISESGNLHTKNKKNLLLLFKKYYQAYLLNMPFLYSYWNTEHLIITQLKKDFKSIFGSNSEDILRQLLIPAHDTFFTKEKRHIERILSYIATNKTLQRGISLDTLNSDPYLTYLFCQHIADFSFTSTAFYLGNALTLQDVFERIKVGLEDYSIEKINIKEKEDKKESLIRNNLLEKIDAFPEVKERLNVACELMYWKNQRLDILFRSDFLIHPLLETIASMMGLTFTQLVHLRYEEILLWFHSGKLPSKKEINNRIISYAMYLKDGEITLMTNKKKYPKLPDEQTQIISNEKLLKGTIARRGKVRGRVRLVLFSEDIMHIKKGEILVTTMTRPDMIVGMEKAAAFVTDHGGMLSHAAIIAREMGKPCIVGTTNATHILKDGDLIEVDAERGIVKLLE